MCDIVIRKKHKIIILGPQLEHDAPSANIWSSQMKF